MSNELDKQSVVEKLARALHIFGRADITIRFETDRQLIITIITDFFEHKDLSHRIHLVKTALLNSTEIDLDDHVITIIPFTFGENIEK